MFFSYFFWGRVGEWVGVEIEDNANSAPKPKFVAWFQFLLDQNWKQKN